MRLAMNDHDGAVWLDANLRYRKVCSFGTPYCARNVGLCKPRWPANARDDCSLPCTHGGPPKKPPHRCPTAPLVERHAGCCCYLGGPSRPIAQILAAVSQERGGHALWCSRGCLRAGALRLACRCSCPFSNAEILRMGNLLSHLLAEHALCAARPCLAVAAQKLHGGAQVSLQGAS